MTTYKTDPENEKLLKEADGLVIYTDGSLRRGVTGWGIHGYAFESKPLTRGIGIKRITTSDGYRQVPMEESVTPLFYFDAYGNIPQYKCNNAAELLAAVEALKIALHYSVPRLTILTDSETVRKGATQWVKNWHKRGWVSSTGKPISYKEHWLELERLSEEFEARGGKLDWLRVPGHSGCPGNDQADLNAKNGGGLEVPMVMRESPTQNYHNPKSELNPLILRARMVFTMGGKEVSDPLGEFYYLYHLGAMSNYAHKKEDSRLVRHAKTDLLLGRRIADASFCVMRLDQPDTYLKLLQDQHREAHGRDVVDLVKVRLDHAFKPAVKQRIETMGTSGLIVNDLNRSITTVQDELISITADPPGLAMEGVELFNQMHRQLSLHLTGTEQKGVTKYDVTDQVFTHQLSKGKKPKSTLVVNPKIPSGLAKWEFTLGEESRIRKLPALLSIDLPERNMLAKLAAQEPRVTLAFIANGPHSYSFSFIFETNLGDIYYQSPYAQYLIPHPKEN